MKRRIAIVEDEPSIRENYADVLRRQGYDVITFSSHQEALSSFRERLPDLAILDIRLEDEVEGGFELCRELRAMSLTLPIIFLTARDSEFDMISGLRLGADDYLTKDISLPHLGARIAALFRRMDALRAPPARENIITRGSLNLDMNRMQVRWRDQPVELTLTEFWLVHALARFPGYVKNREQLMHEANVVVDDSTITSHVKRIRQKFLSIDNNFISIETIYGMGYRWKVDN